MTRPLGFDEIKRVLPHRYPMLLVDRVVEVEPGVRLTARKAVSGNEPWYRDLADDTPATGYAYPPTLLVESWCQAAGLLAASDPAGPPDPASDPAGLDAPAGRVLLIGAMTGIRFTAEVFPGDLVEHRVRLVRSVGDTAIFEGESLVDGRTVLEVERVVVAMRPAAELTGAVPAGPVSAAQPALA
ncbi:MAG TPA: beta-hydroxyacyl-ACP dehydratase [Micromonosporaceae bacterium]|nr:beta-hydroxyacyl-ACP dehydratase [Micromonosporaceae bacterium]